MDIEYGVSYYDREAREAKVIPCGSDREAEQEWANRPESQVVVRFVGSSMGWSVASSMREIKIRKILRDGKVPEELIMDLSSALSDFVSEEVYEDRSNARVTW